MNPQRRVAMVGVLFVATWAALGFGDALLCLTGAAVFCLAIAVYRGELDLRAPAAIPNPSLPCVALSERIHYSTQ